MNIMNYIIYPSPIRIARADLNTSLAIGHAFILVRNAKVAGMEEKDCLLVINVGTNLLNTQIEIRDRRTGLSIAEYCDGVFIDVVSRDPITLIKNTKSNQRQWKRNIY